MSVEHTVIAHYRHGTLEDALLKGLAAAGKDLDKLTPDDLAPADEFHIGGRQATVDFAAAFEPAADMHWLDIGSGLGGPSRYVVHHYKCRVTGVDLSEEYVAVAGSLARRVGLGGKVSYRQASALALPFADDSFDGAYMQHVGMNIADKAKLFNEVHRVLKPGGVFAIYDVMRGSEGVFTYPVPWASGAESNFVETPATYRALLTAEGFEVVEEHDRSDFAMAFFKALQARMARTGAPPAFGLQIVMGATAPQKVANMIGLVERGTIAPVVMICRRVETSRTRGMCRVQVRRSARDTHITDTSRHRLVRACYNPLTRGSARAP
jgi:ubiquinone/menaquinone biosynthesis C-methylase UbiE